MRSVGGIIKAIGWAIGLVLALSIGLVVADANEDNAVVSTILDIGRFFAKPFRQMFDLDDNHLQIALNWGIGAIVYIVAAIALAALIAALGRRVHTRRAHA